ncbi:hypothetical protein E2562_000132 [Oryza meyeriana var. granulata]|uniref:Uncharacterized protein n=1 Tax=Oryza meyeriana var. granulata TaxID=110450 RepID=A0A6G1DDM0_9ORYZ|nr:hypothetical protein E2562_000132 [Oryza meyeriana var. granulata]
MLGSVQQWHAKGLKQAWPSEVQYRRHAGAAAGESDDDGNGWRWRMGNGAGRNWEQWAVVPRRR